MMIHRSLLKIKVRNERVPNIRSADYGRKKGFTLIELMTVVSIIGILTAIALPQFSHYRKRAIVCEAMTISAEIRHSVGDYYAYKGFFPRDNAALGMQPKDLIQGRYVQSIEVRDGAIHIQLDSDIMEPEGSMITLRPAIVETYPQGNSVAWVCGYATPAEGMVTYGENRTSIKKDVLPWNCW